MIPLPFSFLLHASFIFVITRFFVYRGEFGNFLYTFFFLFFFGRMGKKKTEGEYGEWAGMIILLLQTESDVLLLLNEWNKEMIDRFSYLNT